MEREQIIKVLECCTSGRACRECDFKDISKDTFRCRKKLGIDALSLIKELTEENERLKTRYVSADNLIIADTVRKMHSMLCEGRVSNDTVVIVANQVAKEMLEDSK